jgi:hypothetical protein
MPIPQIARGSSGQGLLISDNPGNSYAYYTGYEWYVMTGAGQTASVDARSAQPVYSGQPAGMSRKAAASPYL